MLTSIGPDFMDDEWTPTNGPRLEESHFGARRHGSLGRTGNQKAKLEDWKGTDRRTVDTCNASASKQQNRCNLLTGWV